MKTAPIINTSIIKFQRLNKSYEERQFESRLAKYTMLFGITVFCMCLIYGFFKTKGWI